MILHWIPAFRFLAFSSIFLRDPAQTFAPKIYQKKYRIIFDIKVSVIWLKLRQEKSFRYLLDPASKIGSATFHVLRCALISMVCRCSLIMKEVISSKYNDSMEDMTHIG